MMGKLFTRDEINQFYGWKMKYLPPDDVEGFRQICDQAILANELEKGIRDARKLLEP